MDKLPQMHGRLPHSGHGLCVMQAIDTLWVLCDEFLRAHNPERIMPMFVVADTEEHGPCWEVLDHPPQSTRKGEAEMWASITRTLRDEGARCAGVLKFPLAMRRAWKRGAVPPHSERPYNALMYALDREGVDVAMRGELVLLRDQPVAMKWQRHGPHLSEQVFAEPLTALASAMGFMARDIEAQLRRMA